MAKEAKDASSVSDTLRCTFKFEENGKQKRCAAKKTCRIDEYCDKHCLRHYGVKPELIAGNDAVSGA